MLSRFAAAITLLWLAAACATTPPTWIARGSGAWDAAFVGVGTADNISHPMLRRSMAEARARAELNKIVSTFVASLFKDGCPSSSVVEVPVETPAASMEAMKQLVPALVKVAVVKESWKSDEQRLDSVQVSLPVEDFKAALAKSEGIPAKIREVMLVDTERSFRELAEEARGAQ